MLRTIKPVLEHLLLTAGPAAYRRRELAGRGLVLAYHNVVPDGAEPAGETSLHLPYRDFVAQLDLLESECSVVSLSELLARPQAGSARARIAITFDDAYRGALTTALPELARRGLPATLFVAPGCLGNDGFWWDRLRSSAGALTVEMRSRALQEARGIGAEVERLAAQEGWEWVAVPRHASAATETELAEVARAATLTLGAHTWLHPNLPALAAEELLPELQRPLAWLRERFANIAPWLAYPYGHCSPQVEAATLAAGYAAGLLVTGGWMPARGAPSPMRVPRLNIPAGVSATGFRLRLAGFFAQ